MESRYRLPLASLVVLTLVVAAHTSPAQGITLHLDFEDGALPSAHGWLPVGSPSCTVITDTTNNSPSKVLQLSGSTHFGWLFDLEAAGLDPYVDWVYSVDLRATFPDAAMWVDSEPFNQHVGAPRDWEWHNLRLETRSGVTEARLVMDGSQIVPWVSLGPPVPDYSLDWGHQFNRHFLNASDYYVGFYFGNVGWSSTFYADNVHFENVAAAEVIPEPGTLALLGASAAAVGGTRRRRRSTRAA